MTYDKQVLQLCKGAIDLARAHPNSALAQDVLRMAREINARRKERSEKEGVARKALRQQLEFDPTGLLDDANLSWDQRVMYSIAISLDRINNREENKS